MADNLRVRILCTQSPDERKKSLLLSLGACVARLVVVVDAADIAYADGAVIHVALRTMLTAMLVRPDALVRAVDMDEQMISGVRFLAGLRVCVRLEVLGLVPGVELGAAHLPTGRSSRAMHHDGVNRSLS